MVIYNKGTGISESKLSKIVKTMRPSEIAIALDNYHYLVDDSLPSDEDKVKFILTLMPSQYSMSAEVYIMQLLRGPIGRIPTDYEHTVKNYRKWIFENADEAEIKKCCDFMSQHKRCPDKYKTQSMLLTVLIQQTMDWKDINTDKCSYEEMWKYIKEFVTNRTGFTVTFD